MFKRILYLIVAALIVFIPTSLGLASEYTAVPIAPNKSPEAPKAQTAVPINLQFACTVPFLPNQYRIFFGYNARNHPIVTLNTADIINIPFTSVTKGMRNDHAVRTDEFYFTIPYVNNMPVFVVTFTDPRTGRWTQMRFKTSDFKPCRFPF